MSNFISLSYVSPTWGMNVTRNVSFSFGFMDIVCPGENGVSMIPCWWLNMVHGTPPPLMSMVVMAGTMPLFWT